MEQIATTLQSNATLSRAWQCQQTLKGADCATSHSTIKPVIFSHFPTSLETNKLAMFH